MIGPALVLMKSAIRSPIMTAVAAGPRARTHGMMPVGNRHDREVTDAAAATAVAAQAFGPSSASRPTSVCGPQPGQQLAEPPGVGIHGERVVDHDLQRAEQLVLIIH